MPPGLASPEATAASQVPPETEAPIIARLVDFIMAQPQQLEQRERMLLGLANSGKPLNDKNIVLKAADIAVAMQVARQQLGTGAPCGSSHVGTGDAGIKNEDVLDKSDISSEDFGEKDVNAVPVYQ